MTDRLGIREPVVLAPMGFWSEVSLAAAVSNAGGLGTFGAAGRVMGLTERYVRETIRALRDRTDQPFGAGFITQLIAENPVNLDIVLEENVPVVLFSFADPSPYLALVKQTATTAICQIQSFAAARIAIEAGADIVAVQGNEAGGHTSEQNLLPFLTRVLDAFPDTPVLAAGGVTNGRSLAAVLAAGADGAWMGTAFLAAEEALHVQPNHREALIGSDGSDTVYSRVIDIMLTAGFGGPPWPDGVALRAQRNSFVQEWHGREKELIERLQEIRPAFRTGYRSADPDVFPHLFGEGAHSVTRIRPAREIIQDIVDDAARRLRRYAR